MVVYKRAVTLMEADLGDELVALHPEGGECFGFNNVAASVWRLLEQPKSFDELRDALLEEYDVSPQICAQELHGLLADLERKDLVTKAIRTQPV